MAVYPNPSTTPYVNPVTWEQEWKTLRSNFDDLGEEKRKQKWLYPKRNITLKYNAITKDQAESLYEFYQARKGSYNAFVWFESTGIGAYKSYSSEYVAGMGTTTLVFNLPATGSSQTLAVNVGGAATATSNYTFSAGGGPDGEDKITFVSSSAGGITAPASTKYITCDFTGRLKIKCRFSEDRLSWENFYDRLINTGVRLKGLLNE
jgi:hypothetical protein